MDCPNCGKELNWQSYIEKVEWDVYVCENRNCSLTTIICMEHELFLTDEDKGEGAC